MKLQPQRDPTKQLPRSRTLPFSSSSMKILKVRFRPPSSFFLPGTQKHLTEGGGKKKGSKSLCKNYKKIRGRMGDYHFVYKDVEGSSTQWDDIQRKLGNLPPKPASFKPPPFTPSPDPDLDPKSKSWIDDRTPDELEELEDDPDLDDDRFLQGYRKKRLEEMREVARVARFGLVVPISGSDFVREVSQAPSDVWVVVLLYKESVQDCELLLQSLEELATRYPATKFVKIISTDCIPNYPDRNLPTILVYKNGAVKGTYVGLRHFGSWKCTPEAVALALCRSDPVLNDGKSGDSSKDAVIERARKRFIEKVVTAHEDCDEEYESD